MYFFVSVKKNIVHIKPRMWILVILLISIVVFFYVYEYMKMKSFCNLSAITQQSLRKRLSCIGNYPNAQDNAFEALQRHSKLFNNCGYDSVVDYQCWKRNNISLQDLLFFSDWCRI